MKPMNILCIGECMLELRGDDNSLVPSFAGDVTNFCIYLKRLNQHANIQLLTAIGKDIISQNMLDFFAKETIDTSLVFTSPDKTIGLYMVHTDSEGERSFSYWRSDSAAKSMFSLSDNDQIYQAAESIDYLYFSGITVAILNKKDRKKLFNLVFKLRSKGKKIIFDPNFRTKLWPTLEEAKEQMTKAYDLTDILLSSYEDEQLLFGDKSIDDTLEHLQAFNIDEIVLTNGPNKIYSVCKENKICTAPDKAKKVIDTTSAGDAFNAGYIVARNNGHKQKTAVKFASSLARKVIAYPGAIIPDSINLNTGNAVELKTYG